MIHKKQKTKNGSAIVYALVMVTVISILLAGTSHFIVSNVQYGRTAEPREQSIQIAEAGAFFYRWYIAHQIEGLTAQQVQAFWASDAAYGVDDNGDGDCDDPDAGTDHDGNGLESYRANFQSLGTYTICVTPPANFTTIINVEVRGEVTGKEEHARTMRARFRKPSWSEFAILGNAATRLSSGTEIFGPMHVNGGFRFDGTAHNVISSSVTCYNDPDTGGGGSCERPGVWRIGSESVNCGDPPDTAEQTYYLAGKECPVPSQDFNAVTADFSLMQTTAQDIEDTTGFKYVYGTQGRGRFIELGQPSSDQMRITRVTSSSNTSYNITGLSGSDVEIVDIQDWGIVYVRDNVWVEGELPSGKLLTIAAHHSGGNTPHIYVGSDDITYENYDGSEVLGLAAEGDVRFLRLSEGDLGAPSGSDLETFELAGALMAQTGRVGWGHNTSHNTTQRQQWWNTDRDTVTMYGAIATNTRMGFGYALGCCGGSAGYVNRNLTFDNNLLYNPPPLFPTGNTYEIDLWEEVQ